MKRPHNWQPITDKVTLAKLGKLSEELGEASAAVGRALIQGIDGKDPKTGEVNRDRIINELADVLAVGEFVLDMLSADRDYMDARIKRKTEHKQQWFTMLESGEEWLQISASNYPNLLKAFNIINADSDWEQEETVDVPPSLRPLVDAAERFLGSLSDDQEEFVTYCIGEQEDQIRIASSGGEDALAAEKLLLGYFEDWGV